MSFWIAGAMVVSTAVGAYSSNKASKDAKKGVQKGLDQSAMLAAQAREDAINLFSRSSAAQRGGMQAALDFYKQSAAARMTPYLQGNQAAQNVIGQGAQQANNAILGLPVDMSFTQQPQVQPDMSYLQNAVLPAAPVQPGGIMGPEEMGPDEAEQEGIMPKKMSTADKTIGAETAFMDKIAKNDPVAAPVINSHKKLKNKIKKLF